MIEPQRTAIITPAALLLEIVINDPVEGSGTSHFISVLLPCVKTSAAALHINRLLNRRPSYFLKKTTEFYHLQITQFLPMMQKKINK